jgi:hypothetical protein
MLPERVASHFGADGQPDGWMGRSGFLVFMAVFGIGISVFIVGISYLSRFFPTSMVNVPHKQFWLSPGQRPATQAFLLVRSWWLACLMVLFMSGLHYVTILANRTTPVGMPGREFMVVMGVFVAGLIAWLFSLARRFRRPS